MLYNTKIKIGEETYKWAEIVNGRIRYKNHRFHESIFMLNNTEEEQQRIRRMYNFIEGRFDFMEHNKRKYKYREDLITDYYTEYFEGKEN